MQRPRHDIWRWCKRRPVARLGTKVPIAKVRVAAYYSFLLLSRYVARFF
jgi:hypothetical protein